MKIKDIRRVEWTEGRGPFEMPHWDFQVMYEGSDQWEPMKYARLYERPELNEYWSDGDD